MSLQKSLLPKPGQRITCILMLAEKTPVPFGMRGTVKAVLPFMDEHHIEVAWDNGRTLSLISSVDRWQVRG